MTETPKALPFRLSAERCTMERGRLRSHLLVTLRDAETVAHIVESPDCWTRVQSSPDLLLRRGDFVSFISADGAKLWDSLVVTDAEGGSVYLSKPARVVDMQVSGLYSDGTYEVIPCGSQYQIRLVRTGALMAGGMRFSSAKIAEHEIHRMQPRQVA